MVGCIPVISQFSYKQYSSLFHGLAFKDVPLENIVVVVDDSVMMDGDQLFPLLARMTLKEINTRRRNMAKLAYVMQWLIFSTFLHLTTIYPSFLLSFIHSFILSFIHSFFHSFILSFIHSFFLSFIHSFFLTFFLSFIHSFFLSFLLTFFHSFFLTFFLSTFLSYFSYNFQMNTNANSNAYRGWGAPDGDALTLTFVSLMTATVFSPTANPTAAVLEHTIDRENHKITTRKD